MKNNFVKALVFIAMVVILFALSDMYLSRIHSALSVYFSLPLQQLFLSYALDWLTWLSVGIAASLLLGGGTLSGAGQAVVGLSAVLTILALLLALMGYVNLNTYTHLFTDSVTHAIFLLAGYAAAGRFRRK